MRGGGGAQHHFGLAKAPNQTVKDLLRGGQNKGTGAPLKGFVLLRVTTVDDITPSLP